MLTIWFPFDISTLGSILGFILAYLLPQKPGFLSTLPVNTSKYQRRDETVREFIHSVKNASGDLSYNIGKQEALMEFGKRIRRFCNRIAFIRIMLLLLFAAMSICNMTDFLSKENLKGNKPSMRASQILEVSR